MVRAALMLVATSFLAGCYPTCVDDFDCQLGYCLTDVEGGRCVACDPAGARPCKDGRVCAALDECVPCANDDECGGLTCSEGACVEPAGDAGVSDDAEVSDAGLGD